VVNKGIYKAHQLNSRVSAAFKLDYSGFTGVKSEQLTVPFFSFDGQSVT
jgi:hypothetical protein